MSAQQPLLVTWTPTQITALDVGSREETAGYTPSHRGRSAIVAVAQRSAFIRTVPIPALSHEESARMLEFKLPPLLPLAASEMVWGFRIGNEKGGGRVAIVGAIKADALHRIYEQAAENGVRIRSVLPLAFGSWLAAKAHGMQDCAVVASTADSLTIDIVAGGELRYSRSVPLPESVEDIDEEIATTFCIAKTPVAKVLSLASPSLPTDVADPRTALDYLGDPRAIGRTLFTLELPEKVAARRARSQRAIAQRALVAAIVAVGVAVFAIQSRQAAQTRMHEEDLRRQDSLKTALARAKTEEAQDAKLEAGRELMAHAFKPAQSFTDVVTALGGLAPKDVWLTGITLERGKSMLIRGEALSGQTAAKLVDTLAKDPRFRDVKLVFANKAVIGKQPVVQFGVSGHILGNFGLDEPAKGGKRS